MKDSQQDWKPQFSRKAVTFSIRHPFLTLLLAMRIRSFEEILRIMVARDLPSLRRRYDAVVGDDQDFLAWTKEQQQGAIARVSRSKWEDSRRAFNQWHAFLYAAVRSLRPKLVVETGVLYGTSSAAILQALTDNGQGRLISIDLPPSAHKNQFRGGRQVQIGLLSREHSVGSAVPQWLCARWDLRFGNSLEVLPEALRRHAPISMFVHDSLHTYEHMTKEFALAYDALEQGGLLVSDDVEYNAAWTGLCESATERGVLLSKGKEGNVFAYLTKSKNSRLPSVSAWNPAAPPRAL